jgi:hypothetical protein
MKYLDIYWIWIYCTISIIIENFDSCDFTKNIWTSFSFKWIYICWKKNDWKVIFIWKMIRIMLKAFVSKYIYIFIKILDENFKNYTPNIPKYIISKGGVFSFFHLCCNTSAFYKVTINKGWLCLGLNNAFAFAQYSKMFPPFVKCMHPMCFLMVGTTWRLKDYVNIHHFLIPLLLMLINLHLWIFLAFQYTQINSFISSRQWFWLSYIIASIPHKCMSPWTPFCLFSLSTPKIQLGVHSPHSLLSITSMPKLNF